jgi:hypothetical protein
VFTKIREQVSGLLTGYTDLTSSLPNIRELNS